MRAEVGYGVCMRLHISLPEETVRAIDEVAGKRGRSAFIREAVTREAERERKVKLFWSAIHDYPPSKTTTTAESISEDRKRSGLARERKLQRHWDAARRDSSD